MNRRHQIRQSADEIAGFSLLELVIVAAVMLIVSAIALPVFRTAINQYKLRTATVDVTSMVQRARMQCIRTNSSIAVQVIGNNQLLFDQNGNLAADPGEPLIQLPNNVVIAAPAAAPGGLPGALGFAVVATPPVPVIFNGRGVPCAVVGGVCSNWAGPGGAPVGFAYYLSQTVSAGAAPNWAAVVVTPAGQVKTWVFSAGAWGNR
ncbi:MAG TPA: prepilin-type N-terminal cleavage/methylation domain-containing protein [Terriglobales bacterium]|nr:prepilin-type N-terminal cleavage/methylation domain-containing protein [Terriglobales bacterium]